MDRKYYLPFSNFSGIGPHKFSALLKTFGSAKNAYEVSQKELAKIIGDVTSEKFEKFREEFDIKKFEEKLSSIKIDYATLSDKEYPGLLKKIPNPPILLYTKGNKSLLTTDQKLAIVGTRKMTRYGQEVTEKFSGELSRNFVIVSGLALGVDGQAHKSCLENEGSTIAVLGSGVDKCYPSSNKFIYDKIVAGGGVVISEFPPGQSPSVGSFPSRNRIIAGISQAVLVTQGAFDSGSIITAQFALDFGRPVFAIPGPITSSLSVAPLKLIEKGAKLVTSAEDILKQFKIKSTNDEKNHKTDGLTKEELKIIEILENESLHFDEIVRKLNLNSSIAGTILSMMEIKGLVRNSGGSYSGA